MKRVALDRRTRLRRSGWLRKSRRRSSGVISEVWREGLHLERCVVCGGPAEHGHHAIPKRVLRRLGFADRINDVRNRVPACRWDHESHETWSRPIRRDELPASVFEFAAELGLTWYVDRHYPEEAPA